MEGDRNALFSAFFLETQGIYSHQISKLVTKFYENKNLSIFELHQQMALYCISIGRYWMLRE